MTKEHIIRQADAKEYINSQFKGLAETLEQFDYSGMAKVIRATHAVFNKTEPEIHQRQVPDCILLEQNIKVK